jgi:hypothetical protein
VIDAAVLPAGTDDGIELLELSGDGRWVPTDSPARRLETQIDLLDACAGWLESSERRGYEAGYAAGHRDAAALLSSVADDLADSRDLGDVPPSVIRQLARAMVTRLLERRPPDRFGDRVVEGGLGI